MATLKTFFTLLYVLLQSCLCSDVKCNRGECSPIKDTTQVFCECHKVFRGPACVTGFATLEEKLNGMINKPVPDMTTVYSSEKELKDYTKEIVEPARGEMHWPQIIGKYNYLIQRFRNITALHTQLKNGTVTQSHYISEVEAHFTKHSFQFYLTDFHNMMMGTGYEDKQNILDIFRKSLQDSRGQSDEAVACTQYYSDQVDYFIRYVFALEKEAVLAWLKYLLVTGKPENVDFVKENFQDFVLRQWRLFNTNGCGPLKAGDLQNDHCEKSYHSTVHQQVKLKCTGLYKPFPETVSCSGGRWSASPVCHTEQVNGRVECRSEAGATVCRASCLTGWATHPLPSEYVCSQPPCPSFPPHQCNNCTQNSVCKDHEVCTGALGTCRDTCLVKPCGVNARCSSSNHDRRCTCEGTWKGDPEQGCRSQDLQWVQTGEVPNNAVRSKTQLVVCKAIGPDYGWHSGFVRNQQCLYEYDLRAHQSNSYEVLVDPCEGRGWKWMEREQWVMVLYDESKRFPGVKYYVCSVKSDGVVGKLFNTRNGFMCHVAKDSTRDGDFYSLVPQPCI